MLSHTTMRILEKRLSTLWIARPELIICDEVTSVLGQLVAEEILKLLQRLQDELDMSYLFTTHDLATVRALEMRFSFPPNHDYTESLLSSVP